MQEETANLEAEVAGLDAFSRPAAQPTHGDLWANNLLLSPAGVWYVIDWDGLGLGDPVMDWAMLFGPTRSRVSQADAARLGRSLGLDADQQARLRVYARASLLDWIIDPLADWVQAGSEPHFGPEVRDSNERVHTEALRTYRAAYG
jgi:thiamine kinase-like enzyme